MNFAIGNVRGKVYDQADAAIAAEVKQLVGSIINAIPLNDLPQALPEMSFEWLDRGQWGQMWRMVAIEQQAKVLSALLPPLHQGEFRQRVRICQ